MTEIQTRATFPLAGLAVLASIGLGVANIAGWIHVAWWVPFLPIAAVIAWGVFVLLLVTGVFAIGFGVFTLFGRKSKRSDPYNVTPRRNRGVEW